MAQGLGYGQLDGNAKAMDGLTAMQRQWSNVAAMDGSMATAMNDLAMDGSAMDGCRKPPSYVPYKGTYVPYDGTFGAPDQGQTLDV